MPRADSATTDQMRFVRGLGFDESIPWLTRRRQGALAILMVARSFGRIQRGCVYPAKGRPLSVDGLRVGPFRASPRWCAMQSGIYSFLRADLAVMQRPTTPPNHGGCGPPQPIPTLAFSATWLLLLTVATPCFLSLAVGCQVRCLTRTCQDECRGGPASLRFGALPSA